MPHVSIVPLSTYAPDAVAAAIDALLTPLGGMDAFAAPGESLVLKPNLLVPKAPEKAVCTHPAVITAVAQAAHDRTGTQVLITDSPGFGTARTCAAKLGIADCTAFAVRNSDAVQLVPRDDDRVHPLHIAQLLRDADGVINVAKAKTHGQMVLTTAVKNTFGAVVGFEKLQWHFRAGRDKDAFARLLIEVHQAVSPRLHILDAVVAMEGNGPGSGTPRHLGFLMASTDAFALDAVFARIVDVPADHVPILRVARELGLWDASTIEVTGADPDALRPNPPFALAAPVGVTHMGLPRFLNRWVERALRTLPRIHDATCTACGRCVSHCPASAMTLHADGAPKVRVDTDACISCFCCQEICPHGAIDVAAPWLARVLNRRRSG